MLASLGQGPHYLVFKIQLSDRSKLVLVSCSRALSFNLPSLQLTNILNLFSTCDSANTACYRDTKLFTRSRREKKPSVFDGVSQVGRLLETR